MDTLAAYGSSSSSSDENDESENDNDQPKVVRSGTKIIPTGISSTIPNKGSNNNCDTTDEDVTNNSSSSSCKCIKLVTDDSTQDGVVDGTTTRSNKLLTNHPRYGNSLLPPPQLPKSDDGNTVAVPLIKDYLSIRQNEFVQQQQQQQNLNYSNSERTKIPNTIIPLNLQSLTNEYNLLVQRNDDKKRNRNHESFDSKVTGSFRSYAEYLRSQPNFYNNPRPTTISTTTTTSTNTSSPTNKNTTPGGCCSTTPSLLFDSWENIMNLISMEEQARIKQYQQHTTT